MNIFTEVKSQIHLPNAAEYYGVQVNRGSFASCLFHNERTPSMKLYDNHFHCYGCTKHGDVITLTGQIFSLPPYHAAQKLAQDFHITPGNDFKNIQPLKSARQPYLEQERRTFKILNHYCRRLEKYREKYKPNNPADELHPLFIESLMNYERYNYYRNIFISGSEDERLQFMNDFKEKLNL